MLFRCMLSVQESCEEYDEMKEREKSAKINREKNVLVVEKLEHSHGSEKNESFPIYQSGEEGLLIAEWFEYTPSHGTLIGENSPLNSMA